MSNPLRNVQPRGTEPAASAHDTLPPGTRLEEFEVERVLGVGGFGIVYLGIDRALQRQVAIKEYMPVSLATRGRGSTVRVRSTSHAKTFAVGLRSFINEARMLALFDHSALVKVYRFWEAHGTAYMAMPFYRGDTLKDQRDAMGESPDETSLRRIVDPLLSALEVLHSQGVFHRDIAPDNILLTPEGQPVLLDFGAARQVISDRTQSLTAILKPNFAPVEQYADMARMRQGPWTDLYALGAVLYFMITGKAPIPAVARTVHDELPALSAPGKELPPGMSRAFLAAIDWALAVLPQDRPQSVQALREALNGDLVPPPPSPRERAEHVALPLHTAANESWRATHHVGQRHSEPRQRSAAAWRESRPALLMRSMLRFVRRRGAGAFTALALCVAALGAWTIAATPLVAVVDEIETAGVGSTISSPFLLPVAGKAEAVRAPGMSASSDAAVQPAQSTGASTAPRRRTASSVSAPFAQVASRRLSSAAIDLNPQRACVDRSFFSRAVCVHRECQRPRFVAHPHCVQLRRAGEARQRH